MAREANASKCVPRAAAGAAQSVISLATVGPNALSTDEDEVVESKAYGGLHVTLSCFRCSFTKRGSESGHTTHVFANEFCADGLRGAEQI